MWRYTVEKPGTRGCGGRGGSGEGRTGDIRQDAGACGITCLVLDVSTDRPCIGCFQSSSRGKKLSLHLKQKVVSSLNNLPTSCFLFHFYQVVNK